MSIIQLQNLSKSYNHTPILSEVNLDINPGEFTVVYGATSSGKSVLVRLITGLETADKGQIILRGRDVTALSPGERNIGYVPQSFALYPHLDVRKNISYPLDLVRAPKSEIDESVQQMAELLGIEDLLDRKPDQLSGGQKQRVAIARGLVKKTDIYILDDPLIGLDFKLRERLIDDLRRTQAAIDATFIYTTSDAIETMLLAQYVAVLDGGKIIETGPPESLYRNPQNVQTMKHIGFPHANFLPGSLTQINSHWQVKTELFETNVAVNSNGTSKDNGISLQLADGQETTVGIRPEHIIIGAHDAPAGALQYTAQVFLREDLGGEEIIYLDVAGRQLTTVLRASGDVDIDIDIDEQVQIWINPADLIIYGDGKQVARGC